MTSESLREEIESTVWLFEEVRAGKPLPVKEAEAVVYCLYGAMHADATAAFPLNTADTEEIYVPVNAVNVALTAMAAAQALQLERDAVRAIGMAGLLHDIGMVRLPTDLLNKNSPLSNEDRDMLMRHPADGAAIILEAESGLDIVAVAAYEHHLRPDGAGYPTLTYARNAHRVSRLIAACSGYHALTSTRPFRAAWRPADALTILEAASGRDYDAQMVRLIISLQRPGAAETVQGT